MTEFYTGKTCAGQGLVIEDGTGRSVALVYDIGETALFAAAPVMLAALRKADTLLHELRAHELTDADSRDAVRSVLNAIAAATGER